MSKTTIKGDARRIAEAISTGLNACFEISTHKAGKLTDKKRREWLRVLRAFAAGLESLTSVETDFRPAEELVPTLDRLRRSLRGLTSLPKKSTSSMLAAKVMGFFPKTRSRPKEFRV